MTIENKKETRILKRLFLGMLPVQAFASGLPALNSLLDSMIVGNFLGEQALAAVGFAGIMITSLGVVSTIIASGSQLLCGRAMGRGDRTGIHSVFSTALALCVAFGILFAAAGLLFPSEIARLLGATGEMNAATADYVRGLSYGIPFDMLSFSLILFLQMERMERICTVATAASLAVNLGGNLFSVLYLKWGLFGAGLFTSVSSMISVCIMLPYILRKSRLLKFSLSSFRMRDAGQILYTGGPNVTTTVCCIITKWVLFLYIYALGGTVAMAATSVAISMSALICNVLNRSYESTCRAIAGLLVGSRDVSSLRAFPKVAIKAVMPIYLIAYVLLFLCAKPFALMLGADAANISVYVTAVRVYNLSMLLNVFDRPLESIYSSLGRIRLMYIMPCIYNLVIPVLLCVTLGNRLGLYFVIGMYSIKEIFVQIVHAAVFAAQAHRLPRSVFELCYIPGTMMAPREDRFKATVCTVEDAAEASGRMVAFCRNHGMTAGQANSAGLCIEELTVDTIRNRFDGHSSSIDLRAIFENGHVLITIRDDCRRFDPVEWLSLCTPEDETRSIGIRMVNKLASEMNYLNSLGLNILTIKL